MNYVEFTDGSIIRNVFKVVFRKNNDAEVEIYKAVEFDERFGMTGNYPARLFAVVYEADLVKVEAEG